MQILDEGQYIRLTLHDAELHRLDDNDPERFTRGSFARQVIHIKDQERSLNHYRSSYRSDREMDIEAMYQAVQERRQQQQRAQQQIDSTVQSFIATLTAEPEAASDPAALPDTTAAQFHHLRQYLEKQERLITNRAQRINEFLVEIHKKFSIPFACVVFVALGAPLGVLIRRRGTAVSVGISLVFFLIYWMFLIGGEELADRGYIPPALSMWAPNLVFGLLGIYLLRTTTLDRPLLSRYRRRWKAVDQEPKPTP